MGTGNEERGVAYFLPQTCANIYHTGVFPKYVPSNRVISSPISHKTFFFTDFREGTPHFFSGRKFMKKVV